MVPPIIERFTPMLVRKVKVHSHSEFMNVNITNNMWTISQHKQHRYTKFGRNVEDQLTFQVRILVGRM